MEKHGKSPWFFQACDLPVSTWFSGYGCAELAFDFLNAAKRKRSGEELQDPDAFSVSHQFEINSKAREDHRGHHDTKR